jgi:Ca2+-binding RTX toxin-like protein
MAVFNGTAAAETLPGTAGNDTITGAGGNDKALMAGGNDLFVWSDGDGSDTVEGGTGTDTLDFTGSAGAESLQIGANGPRTQLFRNVGIVAMDLNDVERIELQALGGADTIFVDHLTGTDLKQVVLDLSLGVPGVGDGATDTLFVNGPNGNNTLTLTSIGSDVSIAGLAAQVRVIGGETTDNFQIFGQGGNDKINAALLPAAVPQLALYGGTGNDVLIGSARNDVLDGGEGNDTATGGGGNDLAVLGAGNDLFVWNAGDGDDFVDGGPGNDTLRFTGSAVDEIFRLLPLGVDAQVTRDLDNADVRTDEVERIELRALGGEDTVVVSDFSGTDVTGIVVDLAALAGGAAADRNVDTVVIEGTPASDSLKIASVGSKIVTTGLSAPITVDHASKIDILSVRGGSSDDVIDASKLAAGKISLNLDGYKGADTLIGSIGNDAVTGGLGNDVAFLGKGDDLFAWNAFDGNDTVDGQVGTDTLQFVGGASAETFAISANGAKASVTRDGSAIDLDNVERIQLQAFGGIDSITVDNLAGTDVKLVAVELGDGLGGGDTAPDAVYENATLGNDKIAVGLVGSLVSVTGLAAQLTIANAELGDDTLSINALDGNDSIDLTKLPSAAVSLFVYGGNGNDTVKGGGADDLVYGGNDNDVLSGGGGGDVLLGENGNDTVTGGTGVDLAFLGSGSDVFVWNTGDGSDLVEGEADFDTLLLNGGKADDAVSISANGARAVVASGAALDINDVERVELRMLGGSDFIQVGDLSGTTVSSVAIDLAATAGGKTADTKHDAVFISSALNGTTVINSFASKVVVGTDYAKITIDHWDKADVLTIAGSGGGDVIDASPLAAASIALQLSGNGGDDWILGGAGNDTVVGGDGDDSAFLGAGNDTFIWSAGDDNDVIEGQAGVDRLQFNGSVGGEVIELVGNGGRVNLTRNVETVFMDINDLERIELLADGGTDIISVNDVSGTDLKQVAIDLGKTGGVADGSADQVLVAGTDGNDVIKVALVGGAVSIAGLPAQVTIAHSEAADTIIINGLAGNDTITATTWKATAGNLAISGDEGNDKITGGLGDDHLRGWSDNDKLLGGGGDDLLYGGSGNDVMDGGLARDLLFGEAGDDTLTGGAGDDQLSGGEGNDTITGGTGSDRIDYTSQVDGHDLIIGFDGNPIGGQDVLNLDTLFDSLKVATNDRAGRIAIIDKGSTVDILVDVDGSPFTDALFVATLKTSDQITVGQDVLVGS